MTSAHKLLILEAHSAGASLSIPSRHAHTLGMTVRHTVRRLVVSPELERAAEAATATPESIEYVCFFDDTAVVYWVTHAPFGTALGALPSRVASGYRYAGHLVRIADDAATPPTDVSAFRTYLREAGVNSDQMEAVTGLLLLVRGSTILAQWLPEGTQVDANTITLIRLTDQDGDRLGALATATKGVRVAIAGAGSLGSKAATSLSRSGVRMFDIVDGDVLLPGNVVRHDADYSHVGLMKVEAGAARIHDVASGPVTVKEFAHHVADASNPSVHALTTQSFTQADVIVDATANAEAFNFLADLASEERCPLVWAEVFAGGIGGYVSYAAPGVTPCPSCVRAAFLAYLEHWPPAPRGSVQEYGRISAEGPPLFASDADLNVVAGVLTITVLRVLAHDFDGMTPIAVIGLRRGWIFDRAFETRFLPVRSDDFSCERCWTKPIAADADSLATVEKLLA